MIVDIEELLANIRGINFKDYYKEESLIGEGAFT